MITCLHCWHSDPDTTGSSRWFCCRPQCGARCVQNYLDVRKCRHCNLRMLVDAYGFCGICGEFVMSWILERTLADTLKPDQAAVVEEYLAVRKLPTLDKVRAEINALMKIGENRHMSFHGRMRLGHGGGSTSSKIRSRTGGHRNKRSPRKVFKRYTREVIFVDEDQLMPTEKFWELFDRIADRDGECVVA